MSGADSTTERSATRRIEQLLSVKVRDVPDFPEPGVLFKDINPLLADREAFAATVDAMVAGAPDFDLVAGVEARGFLLAAAVAYAAGSGVVPVRKAGKLPGPTRSASYALEYGEATIEVQRDAVASGARVLVVDDVLATGGTLVATLDLLAQVHATVVGISVVLELATLGGRARLRRSGRLVPIHALATV